MAKRQDHTNVCRCIIAYFSSKWNPKNKKSFCTNDKYPHMYRMIYFMLKSQLFPNENHLDFLWRTAAANGGDIVADAVRRITVAA